MRLGYTLGNHCKPVETKLPPTLVFTQPQYDYLIVRKTGDRETDLREKMLASQWLSQLGSHLSRVQRVGVFNFGTDRVRVLEKTSGSGSGTDRVRVLALHFFHSGIIGYQKS